MNKEEAATSEAAVNELADNEKVMKKMRLRDMLSIPSLYIGPTISFKNVKWVYEEDVGMIQREIMYTPGLWKIFDEILINAVKNKDRDPEMDTLKIDIDPIKNVITFYYNGKGITIVKHEEQKTFIPSMIFDPLLPSFNCTDEEETVTGGLNCYGIKLANIFSTAFELETASTDLCPRFKQTWTDNMTIAGIPVVEPYSGPNYTKITYSPDFDKFQMDLLNRDTIALLSRRVVEVAASTPGVNVYLNDKPLPINNFKEYVDLCLKGKVDRLGAQLKCVFEAVNERWEIAVVASEHGFQQISLANKFCTTKGGLHVEYITERVTRYLFENLKRRNKRDKTGIHVHPQTIRKHIMVFVNCSIVSPIFKDLSKERLQGNFLYTSVEPSENFFTELEACGITELAMETTLEW